MEILRATKESRKQIVALLSANNLPTDDLPENLDDFYTVFQNGDLVGLIGMERYHVYGLLRSMVVHTGYRNQHIAEKLVHMLEDAAKKSGIETMYLLTETAEKYFAKKGYAIITRNDVPAEVSKSSEFSHVCPASAVVMKKHLAEQTISVS